ncbi:MAG: 2-dehydro-3-deoxyphosphogluconate aldolase [Candidatus Neomarinimicrobiota bacterium]|nr:MAG: 2-dehydro-3-deoxyphosphogluconate aldolase [Candidatus Neomarinimicrobiota bacterium]
MDRYEVINALEEKGIIGVIRAREGEDIAGIINSLMEGGVKALEITMTTPKAIDVIAKLSDEIPEDFIIGAGTVLDSETARSVIYAGAKFIVSPVCKKEIIETAHRYDCAVFPGAFTPTEVLTAWENGADAVKIFPASRLGPKYLKDLRGPFPWIKLTPTGGIDLKNITEFIKNGASFVGVGTSLLNREYIKNRDWKSLTAIAKDFIEAVEMARKELNS